MHAPLYHQPDTINHSRMFFIGGAILLAFYSGSTF